MKIKIEGKLREKHVEPGRPRVRKKEKCQRPNSFPLVVSPFTAPFLDSYNSTDSGNGRKPYTILHNHQEVTHVH